MKKLTLEEWQKRMGEISKARRIFIESGLTNNITRAFEIYQEILAEEQMSIFVTNAVVGKYPPSVLDQYERPTCEEDGTELRLKLDALDPQGKRWPTAWFCPTCGLEQYSEKSITDWMEELKRVA